MTEQNINTTEFNDGFDDDFDDQPQVTPGQIYVHPERNSYVVITSVRDGYANFTGFDYGGVVMLRGRASFESLIERFSAPSIEEVVNMDTDLAAIFTKECGTLLSCGVQ